MIKVNVHIKGVAPLLFNRFPDEDNPSGKTGQKIAKATKEEQVEKSLYRLEDGTLYSPSDHIVGAMIKAATNFRLEGKKTMKDSVKGGVFVSPLKIPHVIQKYETDWRSVVNPSTRGRIMKGRGRMEEWELKFELTCIDPRMSQEDLRGVLEFAGTYVGIGDYRPRYGRFEIKLFKVQI